MERGGRDDDLPAEERLRRVDAGCGVRRARRIRDDPRTRARGARPEGRAAEESLPDGRDRARVHEASELRRGDAGSPSGWFERDTRPTCRSAGISSGLRSVLVSVDGRSRSAYVAAVMLLAAAASGRAQTPKVSGEESLS